MKIYYRNLCKLMTHNYEAEWGVVFIENKKGVGVSMQMNKNNE